MKQFNKGDLINNTKTGALHRVCWINQCGWPVVSEIGEAVNPEYCEKYRPEEIEEQPEEINCSLKSYINSRHNGSQTEFANCNNVKPPQVTQWINKGFIVINGILYSPRRELNGG